MKAKILLPCGLGAGQHPGMVGVPVHLQGKALISTPPHPPPQSQEAGGIGQAGCGPQPAGGDSPAP